MVSKILFVGCGITSTIAAKLLHSKFDKISVTVWEKLNGPGGRFSTVVDGQNSELSIDLGAQYITTTHENMINYHNVYSSLLNDRSITLMSSNVKGMKEPQYKVINYVPSSGMTSIVTHFLDNDKWNICYNHRLIALHRYSDKWCALTESGVEETFDAVILTVPIPEILKLSGDLQSLLMEKMPIYEKLKAVKYSSRYALALFFKEGVHTDFDSEYINNDPVIRFVAYDSWRRGDKNRFYSAAVHTTIQFGEKHRDVNLEVVKEIIMNQIYENVFPQWPKPSSVSICYWNYSQVLCPYDSTPGAVAISEEPLLVAGGDGFIGSTFDQCIFSAKAIFDVTTNYINIKSQ